MQLTKKLNQNKTEIKLTNEIKDIEKELINNINNEIKIQNSKENQNEFEKDDYTNFKEP